MTGKPPVAFIGLGAMGFGMATNLVKEGYPVTGFDVYQPTLDRFQAAGGSTASKPSEAVSGKDYCVCMVATAQQAQSVLLDGDNAAISSLPQGAVVLLCSTVPCEYVQGLEKELSARGRPDILLVDCPVSGGAIRAANGTLSIMVGGSSAAIEKGSDLLKTMSDSEKLYIVKGGVGAGSNMKMCHQVLAANQILSSSEALGFASRLGLDLNKVAPAILKSEGWSWMLENRLPRILDPKHLPLASAVTIILKDTSIITKEARRYKFPTPMTSAAEQVYFSSLARGYGPEDDGGLIRMYTDGKEHVGALRGLAETEEDKLSLVIDLLKGIHLASATETLAFAQHVGLELEQVFELCINAAGGSAMLSAAGPEIMKALRGEEAIQEPSAGGKTAPLQVFVANLTKAVEEAQALKVPIYLGNAALNLMRVALRTTPKGSSDLPARAMISVWGKGSN
jgi:3-hydroxyisobutyrate dehydrogenase